MVQRLEGEKKLGVRRLDRVKLFVGEQQGLRLSAEGAGSAGILPALWLEQALRWRTARSKT